MEPVRPEHPFYRGWEGELGVGVPDSQPHPDSGQTEGDRLQGGLAKPQASGKLYFLDVTLCLGQEDETLEEQGDRSGHLCPHGLPTPPLRTTRAKAHP